MLLSILCSASLLSLRSNHDLRSSGSLQERTLEFGRSVAGRPLRATIIGNGPKASLYIGGTHGDEAPTPPLISALERYVRDHADLARGRTLIFIEQLNPDGVAKRTRVNAHGTDLNRNMDANWDNTYRVKRYFPGKKPLSEPESRALTELIVSQRPSRILSIHSPLHCLNYDGPGSEQLARRMSKSNAYPVKGDIGYPTPGSLGKYCTMHGIALVTLELPEINWETAWKQNKAALIAFLTAD